MTDQGADARPIESVIKSPRNGPLIAAAAKLWIQENDLVVDVTYGKGNFWTHYRPANLETHDLFTVDGVDFRHLPERDESVDVVVFDPPYVAPGGRKTSTIDDMNDRYAMHSTPKNPDLLFDYIAEGLRECARILKTKPSPSTMRGRLLVKTMDYVWGGRMRWGRQHAVETLRAVGLEQVDELVHYSGTGPQPIGRTQRHSRRAHTFLCVFEKRRHVADERDAPTLALR